MKLYQYALIYQPKKNNKDNAAKAELIQPKDGGRVQRRPPRCPQGKSVRRVGFY